MSTPAPKRPKAKNLARRSSFQPQTSPPQTLAPIEPAATLEEALYELEAHRIELETQNEELRNAQNELETSHDRFSQLYDHAPVGFLTLDEKGIILEANLTLAHMIGVPRSTLIGAHLRKFVTRQGQDAIYFHLQALLDSNSSQRCKLTLDTHQNGSFTAQLESRPLPCHKKTCHQFLVAVLDVSDQEALEREILRIAEEERLRIASELHDDICQELAGLQLVLHSLLERERRAGRTHHFEAIESGLRNATERVRQVAHCTSPAICGNRPVAESFRELAKATSSMRNVSCTFTCNDPTSELSPTISDQLLRIAQESIRNAALHGHATKIWITLKRTGNECELSISENGGGLPFQPACNSGIGLRIMHYRAGLIGGHLTLQPLPLGGTEVRCRFPLTR